jgi:hypothetical protein
VAARPESELDELARKLKGGSSAGKIIGAGPGLWTDCDIELVLVSESSDGRYLVRQLVMDLEGLCRRRDNIFVLDPPPAFRHTDHDRLTLEQALKLSNTLAAQSQSEPIPGLTGWMWLGGELEDHLRRFELRTRIPWLESPPRWQRLARSVLSYAWVTVAVGLTVLGFGDEVLGPEGATASLRTLLSAGLTVVAALAGVVIVVAGVDWLRHRSARREGRDLY